MLKSNLCDNSDVYTLVQGAITIIRGSTGADTAGRQADKRNKGSSI